MKPSLQSTQSQQIEQNNFKNIYKNTENTVNSRQILSSMNFENYSNLKNILLKNQNLQKIIFADSSIDFLRREDSRLAESRQSSALKSSSINEVFEPFGNVLDISRPEGFFDNLDEAILEEESSLLNNFHSTTNEALTGEMATLQADEEAISLMKSNLSSVKGKVLESTEAIKTFTGCSPGKKGFVVGFYNMLALANKGDIEITQENPFGSLIIE